MGNGSDQPTAIPVSVCDSGETAPCVNYLSGVADMAAGRSTHSLAVKTDGSVWAWGTNENGQLGDDTVETRLTPVAVCDVGEADPCSQFLSDVSQVAAGKYFSLALKNNGTLVAWAKNDVGQLGDATTDNSYVPVAVCDSGQVNPCANLLTDIVWIHAGEATSIAVKNDGSVWAWGQGFSNTPQQIASAINNAIAAVTESNHYLALLRLLSIST